MNFELYFGMNLVSVIIMILCCGTIAVCFWAKQYRLSFCFCAGICISVIFETSMVGFLLIGVDWPVYILLPLYLVCDCLSAWIGVLMFSGLSGGYFFKTKIKKLLLMIPAIIPLVVYFVELGMGHIDFALFNNRISNFAQWSIISGAAVVLFYILLGIIVLAISHGRLSGTQKRLVGDFAISLSVALVINCLSCLTDFKTEYVWMPYSFVILFMVICTMRLNITRDSLTKIKNRIGFERDLKYEIGSHRKDGLFLIIADIDDFKKINDTYGHGTGDEALILISDILDKKAHELRATAYRCGGDEFAIIFPDSVKGNVNKFIENVNEELKNAKTEMPIALSMGVCEYDKRCSADEFIKFADNKMYEQKKLRKSAKAK